MHSCKREQNRLRRQTEVFTVLWVNDSAYLYNIQEDVTDRRSSQIVLNVCTNFIQLPKSLSSEKSSRNQSSFSASQVESFVSFVWYFSFSVVQLLFLFNWYSLLFSQACSWGWEYAKFVFEKICLNPSDLKAHAS